MTIKEQFPLAIDTLSKRKKPFYYDKDSQFIFDQDGKMIIDIRGWGWIQKLDNPESRQDEVGNMFVTFLNENT